MTIPFVKMHAQGNDFIILESSRTAIDSSLFPELARFACKLHTGLGADGLVWLDTKEPRMVIFNADGSRAEMCGSALRCCCALLAERTGQSEFRIATDSGTLSGSVNDSGSNVMIEIGTPVLLESELTIDNCTGYHISVGNPHFVIFRDDLSDHPELTEGKTLSTHPHFPEGSNVEFVKIVAEDEIQLTVWERGAGATLACGTGAAAAVFAGQQVRKLAAEVKVHLPGGRVVISKQGMRYFLSGEVAFVAEGELRWII
jgi:diaminopimelate epimerase